MIIQHKYQKKQRKIGSLTVFSLLFFSIAFFWALKTPAKEEGNNINAPVLFQPPPGEEYPEDTKGGGSRDEGGSCDLDSIAQPDTDNLDKLTAIAPDSYYGSTTIERPTFWVNVPKTSAQQAILLIKKSSNPDWHQSVTHSQQSIDLTGKAGLIGIKWSENAPALEIGESYQWVVALVCGNQPNPNDPLVATGIKRIAKSPISKQLSNTFTQLDKASIYAQNGVWYDALDILIAEKASLNNWNDIWLEYLQSGGLSSEIAKEPVIGKLRI